MHIREVIKTDIAGNPQDRKPDATAPLTENITPQTIHDLADRKGVKWDDEPSFLKLTKRLTGKEHLDDLDQTELLKVKNHLTALDEARSDNWPASTVLDRIKGKQPWALGQGLQELKYDGMKDALITGCLEPHDQEIADWADGVLSKSPDSDMVIFQFIQLLHMKGKFPHLIAVLNKHKSPFVKYLLLVYKKLISNPDTNMQPWYLDQLKAKISALKNNGLDWPELGVLEKSMQAPKDLDEAEALSKPAQRYQEAIRKNLTTLSDVITDPMYDLMWHKSVNTLDHAGRMRFLAGLHDEIMAFLDKAPAQRMVLLMLKLREFAPGWGNFNKILDHRIGELEAWVYHTLGGNNPSYILNRIKGLKDLGMDVSELKLRARELLTKRLKDIINNGPIYPTTNLDTTLAGLNDLGVVVKLGDKSPDLTKKVLSHVDDYIAKNGIGPNGKHLIDTISKLFPGGNTSALLKPIYLKNKSGIIRQMLTAAKASNGDYVMNDIKLLRSVGIDWPEMAVVEKSVKAPAQAQVNESDQDSKMLQTFFRIESRLEAEDFDDIGYYFAVLGKGTGNPRFPAINLDGYKREIMHWLLSAIRDPEQNNLDDDDLLPMIKGVRMLGAKWPELAVMEKSVSIKSKDLDEASSAPFGSARVIVRVMLKRALAKKHGNLDQNRNSVIDKMDVTDPRFISAVDSVKPLMLSEIRKLLKSDSWDVNLRGWEYVLALHQVGLDWPELKAILDNNKSTVIKSMLAAIKSDDSDEMTRWPQLFKSMGVTWPELDVINKSLKQLDENTGLHSMAAKRILQRAAARKFVETSVEMDDIISKMDMNDPKFIEMTKMLRIPVLSEIKYNLADKDSRIAGVTLRQDAALDRMIDLSRFGLYRADLKRMLEPHKQQVVRRMLELMKDGEKHSLLYTVDGLLEMGVEWPELEMMRKSLIASMGDDEIDEDRDAYYDHDEIEADRARFEETFDDFIRNVKRKDWQSALADLNDLNWEDAPAQFDLMTRPGAWDWMDHKHEILRELLLWEIESGDSNGIIDSLEQLDAPWPELKVINRLYHSNKPLLVTASEWYPNKKELESMYGLVLKKVSAKLKSGHGHRAMSDLIKLGLDIDDLPGAEQVFNDNKTVIIKDLLGMIKSRQSAGAAEDYVDLLKQWGINWPELDVIDNSIAAERSIKKLSETDDETRRQGEEMMYTIMKKQFEKNPWFGVYYMDEWNMTPDKVPGLRKLLDSYKTTFITSLLKGIQGGGYLGDIRPQVERLEKVGANWPELKVIKKSINSVDSEKIDEDLDKWHSLYDNAIHVLLKKIMGKSQAEPYEPKLELHRKEIYDYLLDLADRTWETNPIFVVRDMRTITALAYYGKYWPEITKIVQKHKSIVVNTLLGMFKAQHWELSDILHQIEQLREIDINWPELDIIEKSANAQSTVDEGHEDNITQRIKYAYNDFLKCLDGEDLEGIAYHLAVVGTEGQPLPHKKTFWRPGDREMIIRSLLAARKDPEYDNDDIGNMIRALKDKMGLDWPELKVIKNSLDASDENKEVNS